MEKYEQICREIQEAEREAAELIRAAKDILTENKTDRRNVVTEYDERVQRFLEEKLRGAVPEAEFFCEELGEQQNSKAAAVFVIDPIDGTMNFVKGFDHSAISVAYAENGVVMAGAVYDVFADKMYYAVKNMGAFMNGKPIRVTDDSLAESIVAMGTAPYDPQHWAKTFELAERAVEVSLDIRRRGSAALDLCAVACGSAGLYFELGLRLWDYAAGMLLVSEAGGNCECLYGGELPFGFEVPPVIAGPAGCIAEFRKLL